MNIVKQQHDLFIRNGLIPLQRCNFEMRMIKKARASTRDIDYNKYARERIKLLMQVKRFAQPDKEKMQNEYKSHMNKLRRLRKEKEGVGA